VVVGEKYAEKARRADDPAKRRVELVRRDHGEGEHGGAGPEAAPPAREEARVGGGAGAADTAEDLEQEVVGKGADVVIVVGTAPEPGAATEKAHAAASRIQLPSAALAARTPGGHLRADRAREDPAPGPGSLRRQRRNSRRRAEREGTTNQPARIHDDDELISRPDWALWASETPFRSISAELAFIGPDCLPHSSAEKKKELVCVHTGTGLPVAAMECAAKGMAAEPCAGGVVDRRCGSCGAVAYCSRAHQVLNSLYSTLPFEVLAWVLGARRKLEWDC